MNLLTPGWMPYSGYTRVLLAGELAVGDLDALKQAIDTMLYGAREEEKMSPTAVNRVYYKGQIEAYEAVILWLEELISGRTLDLDDEEASSGSH